MADEEDGLTIVLSPVQLAAILESAHLAEHQRFVNRLWGGAQLVGSALQLIGGVGMFLVPEPTMLTKVGGGVLVAHGADSGQAAVRQIWTGETTKDFTQMAGEGAARELGASDRTAYWAGVGLDVAVPLSASIALGAERILAVRAGRISLAAEEAAGGHTIAKHIGQTEEALRARLIAEPRIPAASSFTSLRVAEDVVTDAIRLNNANIKAWASSGAKGGLELVYSGSSPIGSGVVRASGKLEVMSNAIVRLRRSQIAGKVYFIITSYPAP